MVDKPSPSHSDAAFVKNVVLDLHVSPSAAYDNINIPAALVVHNPLAVEGEDQAVGADPVSPGPVDIHHALAAPAPIVLDFADIQPAPVDPGPLIVPLVVPILQDDNNNDSSDEESVSMTDSVIAPPDIYWKGWPRSQ